MAHKKQSRKLRAVLEEEGFEPERVFNATHGARRLLYHGPGGWQVDVFLDTFEMSHTLDLGTRLEAEPPRRSPPRNCCSPSCRSPRSTPRTCPTRRCCCGITRPASADGPGLLNLGPVVSRCAGDWGLYTTVTDNLAACAERLGSLGIADADRSRIAARIAAVTDALAAAPKSMSLAAAREGGPQEALVRTA